MRALLPDCRDDVDLYEHYGRAWLEQGGIRANMIASVDGAASAGGLSGGLQTPGDNAVFAVLRDLADVVLAGSATVRAEGYRPVRPDAAQRARRHDLGLPEELPIAVVSRSLRLDTDSALFTGNRPLVVTCESADADARAALAGRADVLVCGDDDIDYAELRRKLAQRGLTRILCEGGPTVLARVLDGGQLDELCLSVSPIVAGPGAQRILAGPPWHGEPHRLRLSGLLEDDSALFLRYTRAS